MLPVLEHFVNENELYVDQILALNRMIREARENKKSLRDGRIAWEGLATFALFTYFEVTDIAEIAEHVSLGKDAVKKWITASYEAFDVPHDEFSDRSSRRMKLRQTAVEEEYLKYPSWVRRLLLERDSLALNARK